jgi:mannose-6-phosphate isomerase
VSTNPSPVSPRRLKADNFTPPRRTPWGGTKIRSQIKAGLLDGPATGTIVGESWEVSVEPSFPSVTELGESLACLIDAEPVAWLGAADHARYGQLPLLVKLLDAADNLSVQVHPADGDPALAQDESGKPEAWVVIDAEPGAGLYLGFLDGIGREQVTACLERGERLDALMQFVEVSPGDAFVIAAGTPHAIGAGVTLLEPQLVRPGRRGLTYRFWDWNRRYDANGRRDDAGEPRQLHVDRSLEVTTWGQAPPCRSEPELLGPGRERVIDWRWFDVERWRGDASFTIPNRARLLALTCVEGELTVEGATGAMTLRAGQSGVVPAVAGALEVATNGALAFATATSDQRHPSGASPVRS